MVLLFLAIKVENKGQAFMRFSKDMIYCIEYLKSRTPLEANFGFGSTGQIKSRICTFSQFQTPPRAEWVRRHFFLKSTLRICQGSIQVDAYHWGAFSVYTVQRAHYSTLREDIATRLGGDEFAIALIHVDLEHARFFAEKPIKIISEPYQFGEIEAANSASIGVATYPDSALTLSCC